MAGPTSGTVAGPTPGTTVGPNLGTVAGPTPGTVAGTTPGTVAGPTPGTVAGPTPGTAARPTPGPTPGTVAGPTPGTVAGPTPGTVAVIKESAGWQGGAKGRGGGGVRQGREGKGKERACREMEKTGKVAKRTDSEGEKDREIDREGRKKEGRRKEGRQALGQHVACDTSLLSSSPSSFYLANVPPVSGLCFLRSLASLSERKVLLMMFLFHPHDLKLSDIYHPHLEIGIPAIFRYFSPTADKRAPASPARSCLRPRAHCMTRVTRGRPWLRRRAS